MRRLGVIIIYAGICIHKKEFRENLAATPLRELLVHDTLFYEWSVSRHSDAIGYGLVAVECRVSSIFMFLLSLISSSTYYRRQLRTWHLNIIYDNLLAEKCSQLQSVQLWLIFRSIYFIQIDENDKTFLCITFYLLVGAACNRVFYYLKTRVTINQTGNISL
jgi:hypothetical protein